MLAAASAAVAEISLTENISVTGFVDMSYVHSDGEVGDMKMSDNSFALDQAEIDFLFDFSPVTAQVDIQYYDSEDNIEIEQAFASYALDNGGVVTGGRYVSFLGFEAVEPTGLYQYSLAYEISFIPEYNDGIKYTVETDSGFFGISLQDSVWGTDAGRLGGSGESSWGAEIAAAFTGTENLTFFIGGAYEEWEDDAGASHDIWLLNAYIAYEADAMTYGAELNYGEIEDLDIDELAGILGLGSGYGMADVDHLSALLMANYAYSEQASVTGRISYWELDAGDGDVDLMKFTAAHNYAFTDNLALVAEISYVDGDAGDEDFDILTGALELLFSF
jgi:hypothetical protein